MIFYRRFNIHSQAIPSSRISNGEVAKNASHVCMVLVIRPELENTEKAALGTGSIISTRHVLTAAHVVAGANNRFIINFMDGSAGRSFQSNFALIHETYNSTNYANDIALIFLQGTNTFPMKSIISISTTVPQPSLVCTVVGHGFTSVETIGFASVIAHSATQRIAINCQTDVFEAAPSHICATDEVSNPRNIVCPGDNGAGLYITDAATGVNSLVKLLTNSYVFV